MMAALRRYLFAGIVVSMPLLVTYFVIRWLVELSDKALALLPPEYHSEALLGIHIPGMGVIITLLALILIGALTTNFIGNRLMSWFDALLGKVPVVRSIYGAIKQLMESMLGKDGRAFRQVVLVSFPHPGHWTIGFVTGETPLPVPGEGTKVAVFVATTPNPTSGWLLFVPESELIVLDMSVDEGMKLVISGGMINPPEAIASGTGQS
jgi:uncharacterized membrane protein